VEVSTFGIRVLLVEPGTTATEFASPTGAGRRVPLSAPYQSTSLPQIEAVISAPETFAAGASASAVAERVVQTVDGAGMMAGREVALRLPLGKDTGASVLKKAAALAALEGLKDVWGSV